MMEQVRLASNICFRIRGEEGEISFADLFPSDEFSDEDVARLWLVAEEWRRAVETMARVVSNEWTQRWEKSGSIEVDGFLVTTKKGYVSEKCTDEEGFWTVLMERPEALPKYFNANQARKGSLPPEVRDTFFEKETIVKPDAVRQASAIPVEMLNDR
jgi:hypothetical protein